MPNPLKEYAMVAGGQNVYQIIGGKSTVAGNH